MNVSDQLFLVLTKCQAGDKILFEKTELRLSFPGLYVLQGPNGCGKSTLLSILSGRNSSFQGKFSVFGTEITEKNSSYFSDNYVSYVPQDSLIFDDTTAIGNVLLPYETKDIEKAKKILTSLGLEKSMSQNASSLSGGEKQRLALARALYDLKPIVLLDEITSALDPESTAIILSTIQEISKNHLVLFVTHEKLSDSFQSQASLITIQDKKFVSLLQNPVSSEAAAPITVISKKNSLFRDVKDAFRRQKSVHILLSVFVFLFTAVSVACGSIATSFYDASLDSPLMKITATNYIQSAPAFVLPASDVESVSFDDKTVFNLGEFFQIVDKTKDFGVPGNCFSGLARLNSSADLAAIPWLSLASEDGTVLGRYPTSNEEILISSFCFETLLPMVENTQGLSREDAKKAILDSYPIEGTTWGKEIVGVYSGTIQGDFEKRLLKNAVDDCYVARVSYGFMAETCFGILPDGVGTVLVKATNGNRTKITESMLPGVLFFPPTSGFVWVPINVDANGNYALDSLASETAMYSLTMWVCFAFLLGLSLFLPLAFYSRNKRLFVLLRFGGMSRKRQTDSNFFAFAGESVLASALGLLTGFLIDLGINIHLTNTILGSAASYIFPSTLAYVLPVVVIAFFLLIMAFVIYRALSPKDLSRKISEIKQK
jgi:putative ABC transport system ATP-binding protein